jgi:uncharacterized membrane protein
MQGPLEFTAMMSPATTPVDRQQRLLAISCCLVLAVVTAALMPFAAEKLPERRAFLPAFLTAVTFCYLATTSLLFA